MKNLIALLTLLIATSCGGGKSEELCIRYSGTLAELRSNPDAIDITEGPCETETTSSRNLDVNRVETTGDYLVGSDGILTITYGTNMKPEEYAAQSSSRFRNTYLLFWPDSTRQKPSQGWTSGRYFTTISEALAYATVKWPTFSHFSINATGLDFSYFVDCGTRRTFRVGSGGVESDISATISEDLAKAMRATCEPSAANNFEELPLLLNDLEDSLTFRRHPPYLSR